MDLDNLIITVFCMIDDAMKQLQEPRLRQRGPQPLLADSEVLTIETVGEFLGINQDKALFQYFRHLFPHFFPALRLIHRTTFVRQAANLFKLKESIWLYFLEQVLYDPALGIVDSFPLPVCQFARAYRCRRYRGEAAFGKDILVRQTFYGFRVHMRLCWPGVITRFVLAPANVHELAVVPQMVEGTSGILVGDRNYWSPNLREELDKEGIALLAPFRSARRDRTPYRSRLLSQVRYRIDTVFGQLVERYHIKKVWARDLWHLQNRILRKVLSHTLSFLLNQMAGNPPLHLAQLLS